MRFPFLNRPTAPIDPTNYVEIRNLSRIYRTPEGDFTALDNLSLSMDAGNFVAVVGRSGSGKSTLINCLSGIDRPTSGELFIDGVAVHRLNEMQLARWRGQRVGLVFQFFQLLPTLTLVENVMLPMELTNTYPLNERRRRAMELLDIVGLASHAHKLPSGTSGGQQQRVAIARSMANNPAVIVCDEPTGNLDAATASAMFDLFRSLCDEGKTIIMVTHDDELAQRADHVFIIDSGTLINEYLSDVLDSLTEEQLGEFIKHARITEFDPDKVIIEEGSVGDEFFIIVDGEADVFIRRQERDVLVKNLGKGSFFGEMALMGDGRRKATVRVSKDQSAKVAIINRSTFQKLIQDSENFRTQMEILFSDHKDFRKLTTHEIETVSS